MFEVALFSVCRSVSLKKEGLSDGVADIQR